MVARVKMGVPKNKPEHKVSKKTYRSDTGGTVKVLKGSLDPSKHDASRLKYFGKKGD